jgi:Helix-turn-helix domain
MRFVDWRRQARLATALVQLAEGQQVASVAHALGYASVSAFTAMFRGRWASRRAIILARTRRIRARRAESLRLATLWDASRHSERSIDKIDTPAGARP